MKEIKNCKRILIVGDSGRGKSTMAKFLSKELGLKHIELDDIFWIKKFTERRSKEAQLEMVQEVLNKYDEWVIEGTTRHMVSLCMDDADLIIYLYFNNPFSEIFSILKRGYKRGDSFKSLIDLCYHRVLKRYKIGKERNDLSVGEIVKPYEDKLIRLSDWKSIEKFKSDLVV